MSNPRYRACALDGFTIVLDLEGDEYLAVPRDSGTGDWAREVATSLEVPMDEIRVSDPHMVPRGRRDLSVDGGDGTALAGPSEWLRLALALPPALWSLRFGRPSTWLESEGIRIPTATPEAVEAARRFKNMRPFVPWLSRCLPHALLLRSYLRAGGHQSMLVIGVRLFPFEAHSWVQAGDVILTDDLDHIASYSVIAAG